MEDWMVGGVFLVIGLFVVIRLAFGKKRGRSSRRYSYSSSDSGSGFISDGGASFWGSDDCGSSGSDGGSCGSDSGGGGGD